MQSTGASQSAKSFPISEMSVRCGAVYISPHNPVEVEDGTGDHSLTNDIAEMEIEVIALKSVEHLSISYLNKGLIKSVPFYERAIFEGFGAFSPY